MAITAAAEGAAFRVALGIERQEPGLPALSRTVNPGGVALALGAENSPFTRGGSVGGERPADGFLNAHRAGKNAIGEPWNRQLRRWY